VSLLGRVIRLESKIKASSQNVRVVIHQVGESDEKVVNPFRTENHDPNEMLIVVKFVESL
jgi:hypothetical protein